MARQGEAHRCPDCAESLGPAVQVAQAGWHHKVALDDFPVTSMLKSITCSGFDRRGLKMRAEYGEVLLERLAKDLTSKFGKGFGRENLRLMCQFYLAYQNLQISQTVSGKLPHKKSHIPGTPYLIIDKSQTI